MRRSLLFPRWILRLAILCAVPLGGVSALTASCAQPVDPALAVTPGVGTILTGQTAQLIVTRRYPGGPSEVVTGGMTYSSSNRNSATVTDKGAVVGGTELGLVVIHVADPSTGVFADVTFNVAAAPAAAALGVHLEAVVVTPNPAVVSRTATLQLVATGVYSDGTSRDVTALVGWSTSVPSVATVSVGGLVSGLAVGDTTVTATASSTAGVPADAGAAAPPDASSSPSPDAGGDASPSPSPSPDGGGGDASASADASSAPDASGANTGPGYGGAPATIISGSTAVKVQ